MKLLSISARISGVNMDLRPAMKHLFRLVCDHADWMLLAVTLEPFCLCRHLDSPFICGRTETPRDLTHDCSVLRFDARRFLRHDQRIHVLDQKENYLSVNFDGLTTKLTGAT